MTVTKLPSGSYRVRITHAGSPYSTVTHGTKAAAKQVEDYMRRCLEQTGVWPPAGGTPLAEAAPAILTARNMTDASCTATIREAFARAKAGAWARSEYGPTAIRIGEYICDFYEAAGKPHLTDIGHDELELLRNNLTRRGLAAGTINAYLSALSSIYKYARHKPSLTFYTPTFERLPNKKKRERVLTAEEQVEMEAFYQITDPGYLDLCLFALDTGMRQGELLGLLCGHLTNLDTLDDAEALIDDGKTENSAATVPLTPRCVEIGKRLIERSQAEAGSKWRKRPLFCGYSQANVIRRWNLFRDHLDLMDDRGFTFHCLRHTTATRLIDAGVDVSRVKEYMRHDSLETTLKYIKTSSRRLKETRNVISSRT